VFFARPTIAIAKIRDYSQSINDPSLIAPLFCFSGYNVPTWACPSFALKIFSWFDVALKLIIPWLDKEVKVDNSKVNDCR